VIANLDPAENVSMLFHYHPTGIENSSCDPELKRVCGRLSSELV